ncbi:MAG: family 43 glycosylhydrolase [Kiritimatiellia bacterium]
MKANDTNTSNTASAGRSAEAKWAWTPAHINTAVWMDASFPDTVTRSGSAVTQWRDKSGKGRDASNNMASQQPAWNVTGINGKGVLDFDGVADTNKGDYLSLANDNVFDNDGDFFLEVWFYPRSTAGSMLVGRGGGSPSGWDYRDGHNWLLSIANDGLYFQFASPDRASGAKGFGEIFSEGPVPANTWNYVTVRRTGNKTEMWRNGVWVGFTSARSSLPAARDIIRIGRNTAKGEMSHFDGLMQMVIWIKGAVDEDLRLKISGYKARDLDLTSILPDDHPYAPPGGKRIIDGNDPRILTRDGVREGRWSGGMWFSFAGTSVKLIGDTGPTGGTGDIYVDGIHQKTANWHSAQGESNVTLFAVENLPDGKHVLGVMARPKSAESRGVLNWSRIEYVAGAHPERFVPVRYTRFDPNAPLWIDDRGEPLQCHMGGVMFHQGRYYMVGADWPRRPYGDLSVDKFQGACIYSSPDLLNWTYHTNVLGRESDPAQPLGPGKGAGRHKFLRASGTGKFVMLFQYVDGSWALNVTAAAVADKPEGPYQWHGILKDTDGEPVAGADTAIFTDDDGTQYLITGRKKSNICDALYQLTPDCLRVVKSQVLGTGGEAPAMFKHDGVYYFIHSGLSGWSPNDNFYHTATNIWGPWQAKGNIAQGEHAGASFMTQTTDVVPVAGKKGAFIWIGDSLRGAQPDLPGGCNPHTAGSVWLPVTLKGKGEMEIRWRDNWDLSVFDK